MTRPLFGLNSKGHTIMTMEGKEREREEERGKEERGKEERGKEERGKEGKKDWRMISYVVMRILYLLTITCWISFRPCPICLACT